MLEKIITTAPAHAIAESYTMNSTNAKDAQM
jgi:hypothetical protein